MTAGVGVVPTGPCRNIALLQGAQPPPNRQAQEGNVADRRFRLHLRPVRGRRGAYEAAHLRGPRARPELRHVRGRQPAGWSCRTARAVRSRGTRLPKATRYSATRSSARPAGPTATAYPTSPAPPSACASPCRKRIFIPSGSGSPTVIPVQSFAQIGGGRRDKDGVAGASAANPVLRPTKLARGLVTAPPLESSMLWTSRIS